jgi:hypothetical protein
MLQTTITKKAASIISTFNTREMDVYNTGIGYLSQDMEHIVSCDKEITVYDNSNPAKYRTAIQHQTNMSFRVKYLLQCLDLFVYDNFETMQIEIKTISDK